LFTKKLNAEIKKDVRRKTIGWERDTIKINKKIKIIMWTNKYALKMFR